MGRKIIKYGKNVMIAIKRSFDLFFRSEWTIWNGFVDRNTDGRKECDGIFPFTQALQGFLAVGIVISFGAPFTISDNFRSMLSLG